MTLLWWSLILLFLLETLAQLIGFRYHASISFVTATTFYFWNLLNDTR